MENLPETVSRPLKLNHAETILSTFAPLPDGEEEK